jgi:predicted transcriptional regulator
MQMTTADSDNLVPEVSGQSVPKVKGARSNRRSIRRQNEVREAIKKNLDLVFRALGDSDEGRVLKVLENVRLPFTIAELADFTGLSRHKAKKGADILVRRGLVSRVYPDSSYSPVSGGGSVRYEFQPMPRFRELSI